ncbi:hypothetical protein HK405_005703, partial [Cladochytrium tenue]
MRARYENVRVDFAQLPLSYTIALFMKEGCNTETFMDVFGEYAWIMLDEPNFVELAEKVADALENVLIESPGRFKSFGPNPGPCLYLTTRVGRSELTRMVVERAADEFTPPVLQGALNMALAGAFISGNQAVVDCILDKMDVQPKETAFAYVAGQPDLNLARSFLGWYAEKFGEPPTNYLSKAVLFAAQKGYHDVAEHFLTLHSDLGSLNLALMCAAKDAHMAVCRLLLSAGANPLQNGASALRSAFDSESAEVVELLLRDLRVKRALEADGTQRTRLIKAAARKGVAVLRPFFELGVAHLEDAAMLYADSNTDIGPEGKAELLRLVSQKDIRVLYALVLGIDYRKFYSHTADINAHEQPKETAKSPDSAPIAQEANNIPQAADNSTSVWTAEVPPQLLRPPAAALTMPLRFLSDQLMRVLWPSSKPSAVVAASAVAVLPLPPSTTNRGGRRRGRTEVDTNATPAPPSAPLLILSQQSPPPTSPRHSSAAVLFLSFITSTATDGGKNTVPVAPTADTRRRLRENLDLLELGALEAAEATLRRQHPGPLLL